MLTKIGLLAPKLIGLRPLCYCESVIRVKESIAVKLNVRPSGPATTGGLESVLLSSFDFPSVMTSTLLAPVSYRALSTIGTLSFSANCTADS